MTTKHKPLVARLEIGGQDRPERPGLRSSLATGIALLGAYLYGSLPLVYALGRRQHVDLKRVGSGNVGGSNLWAAAGTAWGVAGWLFDASKGLAPAVVCRRLGYDEGSSRLAAVCGAAGQCWPAFLGFDGGRGVSAFVGAAYAIDRRAWAVSLVPLIAGSMWRAVPLLGHRGGEPAPRLALRSTRSRSVPLGCFIGVVTFPLACALAHPDRGRRYARRPSMTHVEARRLIGSRVAPAALALVVLIRRLTARLPDDETHGPAVRPSALWYRLLYDRNTSA